MLIKHRVPDASAGRSAVMAAASVYLRGLFALVPIWTGLHSIEACAPSRLRVFCNIRKVEVPGLSPIGSGAAIVEELLSVWGSVVTPTATVAVQPIVTAPAVCTTQQRSHASEGAANDSHQRLHLFAVEIHKIPRGRAATGLPQILVACLLGAHSGHCQTVWRALNNLSAACRQALQCTGL